MSSFLTNTQIGEKGQSEYMWSTEINEQIVQLYFQLVRTSDMYKIFNITENVLIKMFTDYFLDKIHFEVYSEYLSYMYRLIAFTRDIINGKGEYNLAYTLLGVWLKVGEQTRENYFIELAKYAFKQFIINDKNIHPFGSWKDVKYLYSFSQTYSNLCNWEPLIEYSIQLTNEQLFIDYKNSMSETYKNISLVSKWIPREKSKYNELFKRLAIHYFGPSYLINTKQDSYTRAVRKCLMEYRKVLSFLNKILDTVQIKQCSRNWSQINFDNVTSITTNKQKLAFMNKKKDRTLRYSHEDRILCSQHFSEFLNNVKNGLSEAKGQRLGLEYFTKEAIRLIERNLTNNDSEVQLLNLQWENNRKINPQKLGKMIAMIDTSSSMEGDSLNVAIALGIRIAEKSMFGKRVLTFSAEPNWISLKECNDEFVAMVDKIRQANCGMNTNFASALKLILETIEKNRLEPNDVEDMVLVILSDMQIDKADKNDSKSMYQYIENLYKETGMRVWGKPYKPPHILFWNLRSTNGFPNLISQKNTSMMSGYSASVLNQFCDEGMTSLHSCNPWTIFVKTITNERYNNMENYIKEVVCKKIEQ
jgi:hypothetical protein